MVSGEDYDENFAIILDDYGPNYEIKNHFDALCPKEGYNIDKNKLLKIKKMLCDIKEDCNNVEEEIKKKKLKKLLVEKQVKKLEVEKVIALGIYIIFSQEENKNKILIINII